MCHFVEVFYAKDVQHLVLSHDPMVPRVIYDLQLRHYHFINILMGNKLGLNLVEHLLQATG